MTVPYNSDIPTASFWSFVKIMLRWRGSLWKMIYAELIIWCLLYTLFTLIYRLALDRDQQLLFEKVCLLLNKYGDLLPVTFMLGFYVSLVVSRWQKFWKSIGWVDNLALAVTSLIPGQDKRSLMIRRTIMRYLCCTQVLIFRAISTPVKKRFPTLKSLVDAGYVSQEELGHLTDKKLWLPTKWSMSLVAIARKEGRVKSDQAVQQLLSYITELRDSLYTLFWNDWVTVPILYTQVIFLMVRLYFLVMVLGRQFLNPERHSSTWPVDPYVPFLSMMQFTFLVGWSKVAEAMLNPFGEDDDDFEMNFIIDRNLQLAMSTVDNQQHLEPELVIDHFFDDKDAILLYSLKTVDQPQNPNIGSAALKNNKIKAQTMMKRGSIIGRSRSNTQATLVDAGILIKTKNGIRINENAVKGYQSARRFSSPAGMLSGQLRNRTRSEIDGSCQSNLDKHNLCPVKEDDEAVEDQYEETEMEQHRIRSATSPPQINNFFNVIVPEKKQTKSPTHAAKSNEFESYYMESPQIMTNEYSQMAKDASTQTAFFSIEATDIEKIINEIRDTINPKSKQTTTSNSNEVGCQTRMSLTSLSSFTSAETDVCQASGKQKTRINNSNSNSYRHSEESSQDENVFSFTVNADD